MVTNRIQEMMPTLTTTSGVVSGAISTSPGDQFFASEAPTTSVNVHTSASGDANHRSIADPSSNKMTLVEAVGKLIV